MDSDTVYVYFWYKYSMCQISDIGHAVNFFFKQNMLWISTMFLFCWNVQYINNNKISVSI